MKLKRFLLEFEKHAAGVHWVGVTAWTQEDALHLIQTTIFIQKKLPDFISLEEINSLDDLDQNHMVPNMEEFVSRGIWFPQGLRNPNRARL